MDYREISLLTERVEAAEARIAELERRLMPAPPVLAAGVPDVPDITLATAPPSNPWEVAPRA